MKPRQSAEKPPKNGREQRGRILNFGFKRLDRLRSWLRAFIPDAHHVSRRERIFGCIGALLGLMCTEWISRQMLGETNPWFIAPMGASAVLLFAMPSSPLAQPWSVIGGNVISALVGITCAKLIGNPGFAAAVAVGLALVIMFQLRCLHPPGGAVALTAVLGGPAVVDLGYQFAFWPVAVDSLCLALFAVAFNVALGRRYPHRSQEQANPHRTADPLPSARVGVTLADLNEALDARGELLDISSKDLGEILAAAEARAFRRRFGEVRCGDIMSEDVVTVGTQASIGETWALLARHKIKAIPVVAGEQRLLVGIVSLHDFFIRRELVGTMFIGELMSRDVVTARPDQPILELAKLFSDGGLHHVPVVDEHRNVVGMLTQSDLVAALVRTRLDEPEKTDLALAA